MRSRADRTSSCGSLWKSKRAYLNCKDSVEENNLLLHTGINIVKETGERCQVFLLKRKNLKQGEDGKGI